MSEDGKRVERVDMDRAVLAPKEDSGERRAAAANAREKVEAERRRKTEEQEALERMYQLREQALREELAARDEQISEAAEREISLEEKNKKASFVNTVITSAIAAVTALGTVTVWGYTKLKEAGAEAEREKQRRERVDKALEADAQRFETIETDVDAVVNALGTHTTEQEKVNTLQMLRAQRLDTMMEMMLRRQGKKPPDVDEQLKDAAEAAGLPIEGGQKQPGG